MKKRRKPYIIHAENPQGEILSFYGYVEASENLGISLTSLHRYINQNPPLEKKSKVSKKLKGWKLSIGNNLNKARTI